MLKSVDTLRLLVREAFLKRHGPKAFVITTELHGSEVRGLALCPGRVLRYVLDNENKRLQTSVLMKLMRSTHSPAA